MRRLALVLSAVALTSAVALPAFAQQTKADREEQQKREQEKQKEAKEKAKKQQKGGFAPLAEQANAGPCPYVKVLYDAARFVEFKDKQSSATVGYTGEIEGVESTCAYRSDQPIRVEMAVGFDLGKGPMAEGSAKTYRYWVAVTDRNKEVLAKEYFDLPVKFPAGADRVAATEHVADIVIPRASSTVSGDNFEVLVGFDVTPEMANFNRAGKRFKINAGQTATAQASESGQASGK